MPRGKTGCKMCDKCGKDISLFSYNKHYRACGVTINLPPKEKKDVWNKGLTKETSESVRKYSLTHKQMFECGKITPTGCCLWSTEQRSIESKKQGFGGYRENAGRSKKFKVIDSLGKYTTLQSSYEYECFEILIRLNIKWVRPKALKYDNKNYFADFFLIEHNIWLDPKNDYKAKLDEEKIRKVIEQNNVKLYVLHKEQITEEYIYGLLIQK